MAEKALWTTVMNSVIKEHGESQRRKWKVANENEALCSICEETGGILIRCAHEKCSAHFHLDCALNQGGISLMENGLLICECEVHYKEIIFCSCKQKYDSNKAMIFCDECCDWYHLTCEHISSASQHLDRYTCRSCQDLLNHGKSVSKTLKEKNLEKEFRSTCNQNALRIIGHINELAVVVCPVIDSISQSLRDDEEPIDISELNNTIEYLSTPPYSPETKEGAENSETLEDDCNFLRLYGVHDLVRHWLDKCRDGKASWGKWLKNVEKLTNSLRDEFPMNFNHENITIAQQKFEEFKTLELQKPISISGFDGLVVLGDILKWILEFLQALHNVSQADFWTQHLSTLIRSVQGKVKKALSLTKEESFFVEFAKWFQFYAKSASEIVNRVGNWSNSVHRILRQEVECSLADAQKLLQSADEFPVRLTLIDTLKTSILQGTDLDGRIESTLQRSEIDDSEIEKLNDEKSNLCLTLPTDDLFNELNRKLIFLKAHQLASSEGRLSLSIAQSLVEEAKTVSITTSSQTVIPLLLQSLETQVHKIIENLENLIQSTTHQLGTFQIDLTNSEAIDSDLAKLETLPLITNEEEVLLFLKSLDSTFKRAHAILDNQTKVSPEDLESVVTDLSLAHSNQVLDKFALGQERKAAIRKIWNVILDLQGTAERNWAHLQGAIEDLKNGISISNETFISFLQAARASVVTKPEVECKAEELLNNAVDCEKKCSHVLNSIQFIDENSFLEVTNLLDLVKHFPLDGTLSTKIRRKQEIFKTVLAAKNHLAEQQNSQNNGVIDEKQLISLREVKNNLLKLESLSGLEIDTFDQQAINEVKLPFLSLQWKLEIHFTLDEKNPTSSISFSQAEKLKQFGEKLNAPETCSDEWMRLNGEMGKSLQVHDRIRNIHLRLIQAVETFTPPSLDDMMGISSLPELSPIQLQITALQFELRSWLQLISSILAELSEVSNLIVTLKITNDEDLHQYQELNYIIDIFNSANHLFTLFIENHSSSLIELKEIIGIMNKLGSTMVTLPSPFATFDLIQKIHQLLKFLYNECTVWMERFQYLLPQKVTRLKNKGDLKLPSPADLVTALALPIAQLIKTPLHERFFSVMTEGHAFRNSLLGILLDTNVDKTSGEVMDVVTEATPGEKTADEIITNKINQLNELKGQSEIIPMDMPESIVLQWAIDTLIWLKNIPHPHDSIEDASLPVDQARKRLQEASSLIRELHPRLVMALADIGLMNLDESKGPIGFHPNTFLYLKNAADYYEFLEQEIEKCSEFEESLQEALDKDENEISAKLYLDQYNRLIIQPDVGIKKSLEKMLQTTAKAHEIENLKKFSSTVITKSGRASKKRFADDFIFDDSFEALQSGRSEAVPSPKSFTELDLTQKDIRKKKARPKCPGCGRELKSTNVSSYCTSRCAFKCASELVKALVAVRPLLLSAEESYFNEEYDLKNDLEALRLAKSADQDEGTSEGGDGKQQKNVDLNALLKRLPTVAKSFLLLEKEEGKKNQQSQQNIDIDQGLRLKARALLEDILITALSKQKIAGGVVQGAIIASELEDSIYNKYFKSGNFDRKDYRKHSQMLMHNLRQAHNETLIVRITRNEVTIDQLLGMSAQQLADSSLQEMRQKQYSAAVEDVQRVSTEEELEAKRRAVMAGQSESWRDRGSTTEEVIAKEAKPRQVPLKEIGRVASTDSTNSEIEELDAQTTGTSGASTNMEVSTSREEENVTSMDGATVRSLQIEQKVLASQNSKSVKTNEPSRPTKRPLDADAMTRLTTGQRPQKLAKTGENTEDVTTLSTDDKTLDSPKLMKTPSLESPRLKAPSLLEILKSQNFSKSQDAEDQVRQNSASTVSAPLSAPERPPIVETRKEPPAASNKSSSSNRSEAKSSGSKYFDPSASYIPQMRLLNKEGNDTITISRVKDINIRTTMMTNDKRVQGSLKNAVNIDGRTKIPELQRFITEVLDQRKKIVASVVFLAFDVVPDDKNNGYNRFCEEFTRDQRASISNVSETVQLYVIPPQLKDSIAILKPVSIESYGTPSNQGILYGLIVAKEPGPSHFVNKPHPILPFALSSFSNLPTSNRVALSSTATQPQASPRPGSLIPGGKPDGGSHFFPAASTAPVMARTTAFDSLNSANKPLTAAPRPIPSLTTMPMTSSVTPIEVQSIAVDRDKIRQVADFCAKKGVAKLKSLQENPESRTLMPFLFEGNPGYEEFMTTLKSLVGLASNSAPPMQQHLPPSPITASNSGTFSAQSGVSLYNQSRMMGQQPAAYPPNNNLHPSSQNRRNSRFN